MSEAERALSVARRRFVASRLAAGALDALAVASGIIVLLTILDATAPLGPMIRAVAGPGVVLAIVTYWLVRTLGARASRLGVAVRIERALGISVNPLVNALQLSGCGDGSAVSNWCVGDAQRAADALAPRVARAHIVDRAALGRSVARFLVSLAALLALLLIAPRVAASAWERFTDPLAGHPPYSRTEFVISHEPDPVLVTQDAHVRIETRLLVPDDLGLIIEPSGERVPLVREGDAPVFVASFSRLTEPVSFYAAGSTGRSRVYTIAPLDRPIVERASVRIDHADGGASAPLEVPPVGDPITVRPAVGDRVVLRAEATVPLGECAATIGTLDVEAISNGRAVECVVAVDGATPFDITLMPVSPSGLAASAPVVVRVEPREDGGEKQTEPHGSDLSSEADGTGTESAPESGGEAGESERMLEHAQKAIAEMTPESAADDSEQLARDIDEVLRAEPTTQREADAQESLKEIRESLSMLVQGEPGAMERLKQQASEVAEQSEETDEPPPGVDPTRADETEDRDRLVIDPDAPGQEDQGPEPARLEGDTLIVEPVGDGPPLRIELGASARDLYASLGERDRALVARYFRALAQEADKE